MSILCYPLSQSCHVDWNALAALGTLFAAVVALSIALLDGIRRRAERKETARGLALLLVEPLRDWSHQLKRLQQNIEKERYQAVYEVFDEEGGEVLTPPNELVRLMDRIHELGRAGVPLSHSVHSSRQARRMESEVQDAIRGNLNDSTKEQEILNRFERLIKAANEDLVAAIELMRAPLERMQ